MTQIVTLYKGLKDDSSDEEFAKEFLECYKKFDEVSDFDEQSKLHEKMGEILDKWGDKYPDDANYTCAYVMMNIFNLSQEEIDDLVKKAESQTPVDKESHSDLSDSMKMLVDKRRKYDSNDGSSGSSDDDSSSDIDKSNKFRDLDCSEFAKEFIQRFDEVREGNADQALDEMQKIVEAWGEKCPDDANYTCAYVMMNIETLESDEISELVDKINDQSPVDEGSYMFMLSNMMGVVKFKNENN